MQADGFDSWAIVELMGHVRMAGRVTEEERFGGKVGRVDVPDGDGFITVYFNGSSLYRLTAVSEEVARAAAKQNRPEPVHQWELPKPTPKPVRASVDEDDDYREFAPEEAQIGDEDDDYP